MIRSSLASVAACAMLVTGGYARSGGAAAHTALQPQPPRCEPVSDRDRVNTAAHIDTGQYILTVLATAGPSSGAKVHGNLWLESISVARDSESRAGVTHPVVATPDVPLYGATDVDFAGVSAQVSTRGGASPSAHSFDPSRPGVVVWYEADSASGMDRWRLYIATAANDRRSCNDAQGCEMRAPTTGSGVVFHVRKIDASGFSGSWEPVEASDARGYFCAAPMHYFSRFKSVPVAKPPQPH